MTNTLIRIESGNHGGNTPLQVNGVTVVRIPHETDFPVTEAQLSALTNSSVEFKIVGPAPSDPATGEGGEGAPTPSPERELAQGENAHLGMTAEQAANEPRTTPEPRPGLDADQKAEAEAEVALKPAQEQAEADARAAEEAETAKREADEAEAAAKADAEREAAAKEDEGDGDIDGKPFVSADVLKGSIAKISENLDEFTPRQLRALVAAEEKADKPRPTLIAALQKKLG